MKPELLKLCHRLIINLVRTFYDVQQQIIIDYLMLNGSATENELASLFGIHLRQLNAICFTLKSDRIIRQVIKKQVAGNEFDIDYVSLILTTKYKILKTRIAIEDRIKSAKELQGYICPSCGQEYGALDVESVLNVNTGLLQCEYCDIELDQNVKNQVSDEKLTVLMKQISPIVNILREIDGMELPESWYSTSVVETEDQNEVIVELTHGNEGDSVQLNSSQMDHSVPIWHQHSTVKRNAPNDQASKVLLQTDTDEDEFEEI
eukprot:NODE_716_length_4828_cov_0.189258.p1 type:complete len:262 gc:universal NODE_716_length_4828_cov_0.189258:3653-4438(+)